MAEKKKADSEEPEPEPVEDPKPKPEPETKPEEHKPKEKPAEAAVEAMRVGMLAYGRDVADLCLKAGLPGMIPTLIFSGKSLDQVGADLQAARVAQDADTQIHSAVLSETGALAPRSGAVARDPKDSPLIQAAEREAERYAKARKEK